MISNLTTNSSLKVLKFVGTFFNWSISNLYILYSRLATLAFLANYDVSTSFSFFKSAFVAWLDKSNSTFTLLRKYFCSGKYSLVYTKSFLSIQLSKELL